MSRTVTIRSSPEVFAVIKEMPAQDCEWGEDYRAAGRAALAEFLEGQMALRVDRHLDYIGDNIVFLFIIRDADRR